MTSPLRPIRPRRALLALGALACALGAGAAAAQAVGQGIPVTDGGRILAPGVRPVRLHRAGPPGAFIAERDMIPTCAVAMQRMGFYAKRISCPPQLATRPGLTAQCIGSDGRRTASAITTFVDYDPVTGRASTDCDVRSVISR